MIRQVIVVLDHPVAKELASVLMLVLPGPDGMVTAGLSGGSGAQSYSVHFYVKLGRVIIALIFFFSQKING